MGRLRSRRFRVIHPFHPLFGREFEVWYFRHNWGDERVNYFDDSGSEASIPVGFTDLRSPDPFVVISGNRSLFRVGDLLELVRLVEALRTKGGRAV
jgi:hypothetical protein